MHRISIYQVCRGFSRKLGMSKISFFWQACNESQWTVLLGYPTVSKMLAAIKHSAAKIILFFKENSASLHCTCNIVQLLQQNSLNLWPPIQCWTRLITRVLRFILQHEHRLRVNKTEKNKQLLAEVLENRILHWSENMLSLWFCLWPGNAETLFRWGGKINQLLIAQSLSDVRVKHYESRLMFAQVTAKNVADVFWDTL